MNTEIILRLSGGVFLLLSNAFFVATEFALTRLRQYSPEEIKVSEGLERAWKMTERLEIYLTGCQIGITSTSILLGVIAEPAVTILIEQLLGIEQMTAASSHTLSITLSVIVINIIHTVWGEQAPTYFGIERAKTVAHYCASPLYWWTMGIYPVLYVGDWLTKKTLALFGVTIERSWMKGGTGEGSKTSLKKELTKILKSGNLPKDRRDEVVKALEIDEIPVKKIMIPENEIVSLSVEDSLARNLEKMQIRKSRYPLFGSSEQEYKGVVYASEMLAEIERLRSSEIDIEEICRPGMTVSPDLPVSKLIDEFQSENQELALVTDEGEVEGLVTITDALEVIVGSAEDPMDLEEKEGD